MHGLQCRAVALWLGMSFLGSASRALGLGL